MSNFTTSAELKVQLLGTGSAMLITPQEGLDKDEAQRLRQEGGKWLRAQRERVGLSQRALALEVGVDYYSFISQLESGRGRVPSAQMTLWAKALQMSCHDFAKGVLQFYDPLIYNMLYGKHAKEVSLPESHTSPGSAKSLGQPDKAFSEPEQPGSAENVTQISEALLARIDRLEAALRSDSSKQ